MSSIKISLVSRVMVLLCGILLTASVFLPVWRIELDAPQYPEGLMLQIFTHKLGGQVDIVNGLNHYIGMKTLHAEEFVEFKVLPYIIGAFALFAFVAGLIGKRSGVYLLFLSFALFGILAMIDFYYWEYEYGHNLNPNAAIVVPGMAYQPPLIGFKQLLNFGAYSIPDIGGWMFLATGVLLLLASFFEFRAAKKSLPTVMLSLLLLSFLSSCAGKGPEPVTLNKDNCEYCKMTIADPRFMAECITDKGRLYKFDDMRCMLSWKEENKTVPVHQFYLADYLPPHGFVTVSACSLISGGEVLSPMGGNTAAFANSDSMKTYEPKLKGKSLAWEDVMRGIAGPEKGGSQ